jgi:hypothetical protein
MTLPLLIACSVTDKDDQGSHGNPITSQQVPHPAYHAAAPQWPLVHDATFCTDALCDVKGVATWTLGSGLGEDLYGYDLAGGADPNADGLLDIVVGGPQPDIEAGFITVSSALDPEGLTIISTTDQPQNWFGGDLAAADGVIAVTSSHPDIALTLLHPAGPVFEWDTITAPPAIIFFAVTFGPDMNADGVTELVLGTDYSDGPSLDATFCGKILFYPSDLVGSHDYTEAWATIEGRPRDACVGYVALVPGDLDGDGRPEVAAGSSATWVPPYTGGANGTTSIFHDLQPGTTSAGDADAWLNGEPGDNDSWAAAGPGDLDGDGRDDLAVSAVQAVPYLSPAVGPGRVTLWTRSPSGWNEPGDADTMIVGEASGDRFGMDLEGIGDADGDGANDLLVGSVWAPGTSGVAYLIHGPLARGTFDVLDTDVVRFTGDSDHRVGSPMSKAGDLDGDGTDDFLLGAIGVVDVPGEVYVLTGPW